MHADDSRGFVYAAILLASVLLLNACSAPGPSRPPARIEIQEDVGFTITEDAPVRGDVRTEYEEALVLLEQGRLEEGISLLEIVAEARNGREALKLFEAKKPDICFLDVQMPGVSGLDVAASLPDPANGGYSA